MQLIAHTLTDLCKKLNICPPGDWKLMLANGYMVTLVANEFKIFRDGELVDTASPKTVVTKVSKLV